MKKIITLVAVLCLLASCGTARKVQRSEFASSVDSTATAKTTEKATERFVDTTRTENGKVTITEIEFFTPSDTMDDVNQGNRQSAEIDLHDVGKVKGTVKSIRQTVIESEVVDKGESREAEQSKDTESVATLAKSEEALQKIQEPTPDPYRWRYIFYLSLLVFAAVVVLYLKRKPILDWIKRILAALRKILG